MKLTLKDNVFHWYDTYSILDDKGDSKYSIVGVPALEHCFKLIDTSGRKKGTIKEQPFTWFETFHIDLDGKKYVLRRHGAVGKTYKMNNGWTITHKPFSNRYDIQDCNKRKVATMDKKLFLVPSQYTLDIMNASDTSLALLCMVCIHSVRNDKNDIL